MTEFLSAALPWLCIGISLALCAVNWDRTNQAKASNAEYSNYMTEGMCLGMCAGLILGTEYLCYGLLLGTAIGTGMQKDKG